jgi:hypothetical protein
MKTFQSMAIGGCIVAVAAIGLQSFPDVQWIVVIAAGIFGLVALATLAIEAFSPAKAHSASQPVAQPVLQPVDDPAQPYDLLAGDWPQPAQPAQPVADRWSQPLAQPVVVDSQPLATAPQPARRPADIMACMIVDEVPAVRYVPWLEQKVTPVAVDDDPAELPDVAVPALPLPRRAPTAAEYPLVWDAIQAAGSMNAAILAVYGSKDGKTHRWVSRVAEFYRNAGPMPAGADLGQSVFWYELIGTCDMPGMVAARLGLEVDDEQLANLMAGLDQCDDCSAWYIVTKDCACQQSEEVD